MILIDYNQISIGNLMAELNGSKDSDINIDLVRHMILNTLRSYKTKYGEEYGEEYGWEVNFVSWSRWESTGDTGRHRETQTAGVMLQRARVVGSHPGLNIGRRWE